MANRYPLVLVSGEIQQLQSTDTLVSALNAKYMAGLVGAGIAWTFAASTVSGDPGTGLFRLDNAAFASVANIYLNQYQYNGASVKPAVLVWDDSTSTIKALIKITKDGSDNNFAIFQLTGAIVDNTTWLSVPVTYVTGNSSFAAADLCRIEVFRTGDAGSGGPGSIAQTFAIASLRI